jgi:transcriptional regulator with XRE-family HTH domain
MFYEIVNNLCKERKTTITRMAEDIGLSNAAPTSWRKGSVPKLGTLEKISAYFGVSTDYLLGKENKKTASQEGDGLQKEFMELLSMLSPAEQEREIVYLRDLVRRRGTPSAE